MTITYIKASSIARTLKNRSGLLVMVLIGVNSEVVK